MKGTLLLRMQQPPHLKPGNMTLGEKLAMWFCIWISALGDSIPCGDTLSQGTAVSAWL